MPVSLDVKYKHKHYTLKVLNLYDREKRLYSCNKCGHKCLTYAGIYSHLRNHHHVKGKKKLSRSHIKKLKDGRKEYYDFIRKELEDGYNYNLSDPESRAELKHDFRERHDREKEEPEEEEVPEEERERERLVLIEDEKREAEEKRIRDLSALQEKERMERLSVEEAIRVAAEEKEKLLLAKAEQNLCAEWCHGDMALLEQNKRGCPNDYAVCILRHVNILKDKERREGKTL